VAENRMRMARTSSSGGFFMWFGCVVLFVCGFFFLFFFFFLFRVFLAAFLAQSLQHWHFVRGLKAFFKVMRNGMGYSPEKCCGNFYPCIL